MIVRLGWLVLAGGVGAVLAVLLDYITGEPLGTPVNPWKAKIRNGFLLPALALWLLFPLGPVAFEVVTAWAGILVTTVVCDLVGWDWRGLFRRTKVTADATR
jgi:hypothetical protein